MVRRDTGTLPMVKVGDNVLVMPYVNRGRGDPANLLCVVLDEKDGRFKVATKNGVLNSLHRDCQELS